MDDGINTGGKRRRVAGSRYVRRETGSQGLQWPLACLLVAATAASVCGQVIFEDDFTNGTLDSNDWECLEGYQHGWTKTADCPTSSSNGYITFEHHTFNEYDPGNSCLSQEIRTKSTMVCPDGIEFEARLRIRTPVPNGLVAGFFTYMDNSASSPSNPLESDEIDIELLTNQMNFLGHPGQEGDWIVVAAYDDFASDWVPDPYHHQEANPFVYGLDLGKFNTFKIHSYSNATEWYWVNDNGQDVRIFATTDPAPDEQMAIHLNFWAADFNLAADRCNWPLACDPWLRPAAKAEHDVVAYLDVDYVAARLLDVGDFDRDGDVDLWDFAHWHCCFAGPDQSPNNSCGGCIDADVHRDRDVDFHDFGVFQCRYQR